MKLGVLLLFGMEYINSINIKRNVFVKNVVSTIKWQNYLEPLVDDVLNGDDMI